MTIEISNTGMAVILILIAYYIYKNVHRKEVTEYETRHLQ